MFDVGCVDFSDFGPCGFLPQALFFALFENTPHRHWHFTVRFAISAAHLLDPHLVTKCVPMLIYDSCVTSETHAHHQN
jgi:hypothetical protein